MASYHQPLTFEVTKQDCFEVTSHRPGGHGYPQRQTGLGYPEPWHRIIYEQCFGLIPSGQVVRHRCDNRLCINPEHLVLGSRRDNMMDFQERGLTTRGSQHWNSKLTEDDVRFIRRAECSDKEYAQQFGVSRVTVNDARLGRTWGWLDG